MNVTSYKQGYLGQTVVIHSSHPGEFSLHQTSQFPLFFALEARGHQIHNNSFYFCED